MNYPGTVSYVKVNYEIHSLVYSSDGHWIHLNAVEVNYLACHCSCPNHCFEAEENRMAFHHSVQADDIPAYFHSCWADYKKVFLHSSLADCKKDDHGSSQVYRMGGFHYQALYRKVLALLFRACRLDAVYPALYWTVLWKEMWVLLKEPKAYTLVFLP